MPLLRCFFFPECLAMTNVSQTWKDVPVDWEALEDAFENNAPEVHSYLHVKTGEVLRVVDGIADPDMHSRIALDTNYMRIDPVSSREQYRWMERFIPMVEDADIQDRLVAAIDGKGAFRRFKDVLMAFATERERWFAFRSERLRVFMEAWLNAHGLNPVARPQPPVEVSPPPPVEAEPAPSSAPERQSRASAELFRKQLGEIVETLGTRDLDKLVAFAEFLKARRVARSYSQRGEGHAATRPSREATSREGLSSEASVREITSELGTASSTLPSASALPSPSAALIAAPTKLGDAPFEVSEGGPTARRVVERR